MTSACEHVDFDSRCCGADNCAYQQRTDMLVVCNPPKGVNPTFYSVTDWNKAEEKLVWQASNEGLDYEPDWR